MARGGLVRPIGFALGLAIAWAGGLAPCRPATAAPLEPALQQHLLGLYDQFNRALDAGRLDEALQLRSAAVREQLQAEFGAAQTAEERREMLALYRSMRPETLDIRHTTLSIGGGGARIIALGSRIVAPGSRAEGGPAPGSVLRTEMILDFVQEDGVWKYGTQTFGSDPATIKPCGDDRFEPLDAFDTEASAEVGGVVARVSFQPDHTLVAVRDADAETCGFLPDRDTLQSMGFKAEILAPYAVIVIEGFPHRSDPQKLWIDNLSVLSE